MANRKPCIKCGRNIDEFARVCPYCNWWQSQPLPAQTPAAALPPRVAPLNARTRNTVVGAITFGFLVMVAFAIGTLFHSSGTAIASQSNGLEKNEPAPPESPHATVTLVPVTEGAPPPATESPITTVPTGTTTSGSVGPNDATALPSEQYAAAAERMRASQQATASVVDPRSITAAPYEPPVRRPARPRVLSTTVETQPVPLFQPVPRVHVAAEETAQLSLVVGTDGRVHDIDVQRAVPGVMGSLVDSVQQWRFRPAMENGEPVSSRFSVAVTFHP